MRRVLFAGPLLFAAAGAAAWPACDVKGITPPVSLQREAPAFPPAAREVGIEGSVEIALTVLSDGRVGWVRVLRADPPGYFEQAAVAGVRQWRFEPARANGETVECRLRTLVRFALVDTVDTSRPGASARRPAPVYPAALFASRIEGYAEVEFEVRTDGRVANARVINAMPRGEFEAAALAAVRGWRPDPAEAADAGARRMTRRFEFRLPDSARAWVPPTTFASAPFPLEACERRATGRVALEVDTDATGKVRAARILSSQPEGLFDATALAIARGSRLTPAYRDGQPFAAKALLTLFFDPGRASCPGLQVPDPQRPGTRRPTPRVSGTMNGPPHAPTRGPARTGARPGG